MLAERELAWRIGGETRRIQELHIQKDHRDVLVLSWYRVGTRSTASYFRQQWLGLWADLMGSELPSALFRFSAPLDPERLEEARSTLRDFIDRAVPLLEETLERPAEAPRAS